jgi:hypothetical protein
MMTKFKSFLSAALKGALLICIFPFTATRRRTVMRPHGQLCEEFDAVKAEADHH